MGDIELARAALEEARASGNAVHISWRTPEEETPYFTQIGIVEHVAPRMFQFKTVQGTKLVPIDAVVEVGRIGTSEWLYYEE